MFDTVGASATHTPAGTAPIKLLPALVGAAQGMRLSSIARRDRRVSWSFQPVARSLLSISCLPCSAPFRLSACARRKKSPTLGIATAFGVGIERIHLERIG